MNQEEQDVLMDHNYDGIQEFDYALPNWWLVTFWGGIIFAVVYIVYYIFLNGPSLQHTYYAEMEQIRKVRADYLAKLKEFDSVKFNRFKSDENMRLYGLSVYESNCLACHNHNAAGDIGPNLSDNHWIYTEGTDKELFQFIITGSPTAGMPAWGGVLSQDDLYAVTAYIASLKGFRHTDPIAKEPQGDEYG